MAVTAEQAPGYRRWLPPLLLVVLLSIGFLLAKHVFTNPSWYPLRVIEVKGDFDHLDRQHLKQVVAGVLRGGFFNADIRRIREAVERLPWVHRVFISRHWPDRLSMWVEEQIPLANWGEHAMVNQQGEIFRPRRRDPKVKLQLLGEDKDAMEVVALYRSIRSRLVDGQPPITRFGKNLHRDWFVEFADGLRITMGRDRVAERLAQFFALLPSIQARQPGKRALVVDLRYEQGFSVQWADRVEASGEDA